MAREPAPRCAAWGIEMLVAFGSSVDRNGRTGPRDLDLAVTLTGGHALPAVMDALITHLDFEQIDLMDLTRAGIVARAQALGRGELLYEGTLGTFVELQIIALVQHADTQWLRDLELEALTR